MGQVTSVEDHGSASSAIACVTKHVQIKWAVGGVAQAGSLDLSTPETTAATGMYLLGKIRGSYANRPPARLNVEVRLAPSLSMAHGENFVRFAEAGTRAQCEVPSSGRKIVFAVLPPWDCAGLARIRAGCLAFCHRAGIAVEWTLIESMVGTARTTDNPAAPRSGSRQAREDAAREDDIDIDDFYEDYPDADEPPGEAELQARRDHIRLRRVALGVGGILPRRRARQTAARMAAYKEAVMAKVAALETAIRIRLVDVDTLIAENPLVADAVNTDSVFMDMINDSCLFQEDHMLTDSPDLRTQLLRGESLHYVDLIYMIMKSYELRMRDVSMHDADTPNRLYDEMEGATLARDEG